MLSQRIFAIVVGILMLSSVAGFAIMNVYQAPPENTIPSIIDKPLGPQDRVYILQTGRVLIEYLYPEGCTDCSEKIALYQSFVNNFKDYAVLELAEVPANETADRIIGNYGDTMELGNVTTGQDFMAVFCSVAMKQPKECLIMEM
ncbi:MAG: hypothetical protein JW716_04965 [Candidatus Aenigmarchaeota archaeon]|nr:hypothetical protein [Candidatus Aenigmarchaeota archaeon]